MSVAACAALVARGDPDRFRATMATPVSARGGLFPLFAFNLEVARAPWMTSEPMIAEMRLQWWRDVLAEIAGDGPVRRHEVATPLAQVLDAEGASLLDRLIAARRSDIGDGPGDAEGVRGYLDDTGGTLMMAAGRVVGAPADDAPALRRLGWALGCANWLRAYPELIAAGKTAFGGAGVEELPALAEDGLRRLATRPSPRTRPGRIAALAAHAAPLVLRRAARDPGAIAEGRLDPSPFRMHLSLMRARLSL